MTISNVDALPAITLLFFFFNFPGYCSFQTIGICFTRGIFWLLGDEFYLRASSLWEVMLYLLGCMLRCWCRISELHSSLMLQQVWRTVWFSSGLFICYRWVLQEVNEQSMASCSPGCPASPSSEPGSQPPSSMLTGQGPVPTGFLEKGHEKYTDFDTGWQVSEKN